MHCTYREERERVGSNDSLEKLFIDKNVDTHKMVCLYLIFLFKLLSKYLLLDHSICFENKKEGLEKILLMLLMNRNARQGEMSCISTLCGIFNDYISSKSLSLGQ